MNTEELMMKIKTYLENDSEIELVSPIMYDPAKLLNCVSIAIMEKRDNGYIKRFTINVNDNLK